MSKGYPEACSFSEVLEHFKNEAQQEELYRLCNQDAILLIAQSIDDVAPLSVQDRHLFCTAPVNIRKAPVLDTFVRFVQRCAALDSCVCYSLQNASCCTCMGTSPCAMANASTAHSCALQRSQHACRYAAGQESQLLLDVPTEPPATLPEMRLCETAYNIVELWLWLSLRFDHFPDRPSMQVRVPHTRNEPLF